MSSDKNQNTDVEKIGGQLLLSGASFTKCISFTLMSARISNNNYYEVWDDIVYSFPLKFGNG